MKNQQNHYHQLTLAQRYQISAQRQAGRTLDAISEQIGVSKSTISRELKRNTTPDGYDPEDAHKVAIQRRKTAIKANKKSAEIEKIIHDQLILRWSPAAISDRLKIERPALQHLSHTTIYRRIEEDRRSGGRLYMLLPRFGKTRWRGGKRKARAGVAMIPDRVDISERPTNVERRSAPGDWEGDLVYGKNAHLVTLVDRMSRLTLAKLVHNKTKEHVAEAIIELLGKVSCPRTITFDNGGEFADHARISKATGASIFFARPYASWQRGTNENTNGRLRRVWPKKFDMAGLTAEDVEQEVFILNLTPRKVLNGLTPLEAFTGQRVALIG